MAIALTAVEKIATRHAVGLPAGGIVRSGEIITIRPRHVMTHDNTGAVIPKFRQMGATTIHDPRQPVFAIDHDIQNTSAENLGKYARIAAFAREHGIDFYPEGTGIAHQIMVEQGYVVPGSMVVGSDSHSNLYGAIHCLGTPVVRTDAASLWATGVTWWQVPPVARVTLRGRLRNGAAGKDVIITLCGLFRNDEVLNHAVEFFGDGVASLSIEERMTIANMTTEWGALVGLFPFDEVTRAFLQSRADYFAAGQRPGLRSPRSLGNYTRDDVDSWWAGRHELLADDEASYAAELELDLDSVTPHVCGPNDVKTMVSLADLEPRRVRVQKAWLMSCVNARGEDLAAAAAIVRGKKVAEGVEFYLAAVSAEVQAAAERAGHWQDLLAAGAIALPAGCGTCIGLGRGTIRAGEVGISATNRNFEGRMGDRNGQVYLGSPAVVAASALMGHLCSPTPGESTKPRGSYHRTAVATSTGGVARMIDGFPASLKGRLWFLDRDNLNTDGIFAGKHTYNDSLTPEQMAEVIFENYDPAFRTLARPGDIIVSGYNFGTGSSREQAATALKYFGIPCAIAASFSETYKRNAFNNGFVVFECPALVDELRSIEHKTPSAMVGEIEIDHARGRAAWAGRQFPFTALSPTAQELVVAGGAETVVRNRLQQSA
ncbi:MAG: homoaconitase [Gemmataceae bacterium]|nr:homoaconitase [Gemmataceae bacterium]